MLRLTSATCWQTVEVEFVVPCLYNTDVISGDPIWIAQMCTAFLFIYKNDACQLKDRICQLCQVDLQARPNVFVLDLKMQVH